MHGLKRLIYSVILIAFVGCNPPPEETFIEPEPIPDLECDPLKSVVPTSGQGSDCVDDVCVCNQSAKFCNNPENLGKQCCYQSHAPDFVWVGACNTKRETNIHTFFCDPILCVAPPTE